MAWLLLSCPLGLWATSARAQFLTTPVPLSASIPDVSTFLAKNSLAPSSPFAGDDTTYAGVPVGTWTIYPIVGSRLQYDDNILNSATDRIADLSEILSPTFIATRNHGIQNTLVYGTLDIAKYLNNPKADYNNGRVGFEHTWEARRDLVFNVTGDFVRSTDVSNGGNALGVSPFYPIQSTTARGSVSVLKYAGPWFFDTSGSLLDTSYSNSSFVNGPTLSQNYRDFSDGAITQRVGYSFDSNFYAFEDTVVDWQNMYLSPETSSTGVRETVGLGALQFRNFGGEVFAGYQQRGYVTDQIGTVADPVLGAKVSWQPRRYLTFTASADETLQTASLITPLTPTPSASKNLDLAVSGAYTVSPNWQAGANLKFERDVSVNIPQINELVSAGIDWQYTVNRAFLLTANIQNNHLYSSLAGSGYQAVILSTGLTYRY